MDRAEHPVQQEVDFVVVWQKPARTKIETYQVGYEGVTRIEVWTKLIAHNEIPYVRVWRGDVAVGEWCQQDIVRIYFEDPRCRTADDRGDAKGASMSARKLTLYRDDSTVQVVFENVKAVFWTAGNTVLVISQYTDVVTGDHRYIHWPRERFCWFKDEPERKPAA